MSRLLDALKGQVPSYLAPLFWQHGESESVLRQEMRQMHANGIRACVLEARPHPDFLGERWWHDLDIILDEARQSGMQVYVFDDSHFPSGYSAGLVRDHHPEFLKTYLDERHIDAFGPLQGSSFNLRAWLAPGESLVRVVAARRTTRTDPGIDGRSLVEISDHVIDGILYWDVPPGDWRIFLFICTRQGGEEGTRDYLNPLLPEAVRAYLDYVYEPHYRHYSALFGNTFAGFFSDEPRFGNAPTYEAVLGKYRMVLPFSPRLLEQLSQAFSADFSPYLPCLWYDAGPEATHTARYTFMDVVSRLYAENYTSQIGDWCRQHRVKLIGHLVEDNGAHARLGYGAGHFFRAINGQDVSGLDVVYQIWPGYDSGLFTTPFGDWNADFFYWGIARLASSAAHIDPKKAGVTMCEAFGAYGWQEGLKLMKWLTDALCVRGVNAFIPHAFSPKENDPDCPPHFYARGANPQWRYFGLWAAYANRLCHLLSGGRHSADVAVLYHAEAEWAGAAEPFHFAVRTLAEAQVDCDVLPVDVLVDPALAKIESGCISIHQESYRALIIPASERLPENLLARLVEMAQGGVEIIFLDRYPLGPSQAPQQFETLLANLQAEPCVSLNTHASLVKRLRSRRTLSLEVTPASPSLRSFHYNNAGADLYLFTNESRTAPVDASLQFPQTGNAAAYDPLDNHLYRLETSTDVNGISVLLFLEPYQSVFIVFGDQAINDCLPQLGPGEAVCSRAAAGVITAVPDLAAHTLAGDWQVTAAPAETYPHFSPQPAVHGLGNVALPGLLPRFSGTLRYETTFPWDGEGQPTCLDLGQVYETAEAWLNDHPLGVRICPPYRFVLNGEIQRGENHMVIEVTNTLAKSRGDNVFDRAMPQEPSGLIGPVRLFINM